jgi:YD repeat-containing protein
MNATIADPDGTIYYFNSTMPHINGNVSAGIAFPNSIEDRNGNIVTFTDTFSNCGISSCAGGITATDTVGRTVLAINGFGNASGDTITVSGLDHPYQVSWGNLAPEDNASGTNQYSVGVASLNEPTAQSHCGTVSASGYPAAGVGVSSIVLPNTTTYKFAYDPNYGYLSQVTYPTGATINYQYGLSSPSSFSATDNFYSTADGFAAVYVQPDVDGIHIDSAGSFNCAYRYSPAVLTQRTVSFDGRNTAIEQQFSYTTKWNTPPGPSASTYWYSKTTTVKTTDYTGATPVSYSTVYTFAPYRTPDPPYYPSGGVSGLLGGDSVWSNTALPPVQAESPVFETKVQYYKDTNVNGAPVLTVTKGWGLPNQLTCEVHQLDTGQISGTFYTWQAVGVLADKKEFDFGVLPSSFNCNIQTVPPAGFTPTRETMVSFQALKPNPVFYQPNPNDTAMPTIVDRPCRVITYGNGVRVSETDSFYDGGNSVCGAGGTQSVTSASVPSGTHDEVNFSVTSANARGNATTITGQCLGCTNESFTYTYDETGQVMSATDTLGNTTSYSYNDNSSWGGAVNPAGNSNAYLTLITDPLLYTKSFSYNYLTGELASETDKGNQPTQYVYNDPLNRLKQITYPDNGVTAMNYDDSTPSVETIKSINQTESETSFAIMDGMGHVIETQSSDQSGADVVRMTYNGTGHVYTKTNPFFIPSSPSHVFVPPPTGTPFASTYYDALGRPVETVKQDGTSVLQWCYDGIATSGQTNCNPHLGSRMGTWVDATDENGNDWQRTTDGLGRLVEVMEPSGTAQKPSMETDYSYNALNDLLSVQQWGGPTNSAATNGPISRSFTYDSLSRLLSAFNPETGTSHYSYDANGNLSSKTDARGVTTSYLYDPLNRVYSKRFSGNANGSLTSCYTYDSATLGTWRLSNAWTQSATAPACPASPSSVPPTNYVTWRSIGAYDQMGRLLSEQQYTPANRATGTPYSPQYMYDLAGNLIFSTDGITPASTTPNPSCQTSSTPTWSTLTYSNCYNNAGRLSSVNSNMNNGGTLPASLFSAPSYAAFGGLQSATYGPSLNLSRGYDTRLRLLNEIDTGTGVTPATSSSATVTITGSEHNQ